MSNKKELEEQGYSFGKVNGKEFLDFSAPVEKKVIRCPMMEAEVAMRNHFLETSRKRGKSLEILLPLVDQEDMTDLLSELYDLRAESKQRKAEDKMAEEKMVEVMGQVGAVLNHPDIVKQLNSVTEPKCRPKKTQPKKPQEKKTQKKK